MEEGLPWNLCTAGSHSRCFTPGSTRDRFARRLSRKGPLSDSLRGLQGAAAFRSVRSQALPGRVVLVARAGL